MFFKDYKFEILIGSTLALASVYLFYQLMTIKPRQVNPLDKMSFEMIRPQQDVINEFSLNGREIDSRFENPFVKKDLHKDQKDNKPKLVPITQKTLKKENKAKKPEVPKKTGIQTRVVPRDPSRPVSDIEDSGYNGPVNTAQGNTNNKNNDRKQPDKLNNAEKDKLSMSEFADLLVDPKSERVKELIAALNANKIEMSEYYVFLGKMLDSADKPAVQSVGVYLAYYTPTYESFKTVVNHQDKLTGEVKTYSDQFLASFSQSSKLPVLAQALQSNDIKVVVKAGEVIINGLQKIQNGQSIDYGARNNRGNNEAKSASILGYFAPIAENLKSSQNQTIASIGAALSQQLSQMGATL